MAAQGSYCARFSFKVVGVERALLHVRPLHAFLPTDEGHDAVPDAADEHDPPVVGHLLGSQPVAIAARKRALVLSRASDK